MKDGVFKPTAVGTPQGGVISPLSANIVLNALDWYMEEKNIRFVRYADDFLVLCQTRKQAEEVLMLIKAFINENLGLTLNEGKTSITTYGKGYSFLGAKECKVTPCGRASLFGVAQSKKDAHWKIWGINSIATTGRGWQKTSPLPTEKLNIFFRFY